jgi:hypothetical protein
MRFTLAGGGQEPGRGAWRQRTVVTWSALSPILKQMATKSDCVTDQPQMDTDEPSAASEAATKPDVTADERRWTQIESQPEPEQCVAGGCP